MKAISVGWAPPTTERPVGGAHPTRPATADGSSVGSVMKAISVGWAPPTTERPVGGAHPTRPATTPPTRRTTRAPGSVSTLRPTPGRRRRPGQATPPPPPPDRPARPLPCPRRKPPRGRKPRAGGGPLTAWLGPAWLARRRPPARGPRRGTAKARDGPPAPG